MAPLPEMRGFVPNPSGRGTVDILWTCVSTIIICAWTSLHPDVYLSKTQRSPSFYSYNNKFLLAFLMLLVPEAALSRALVDHLLVRDIVASVNNRWPACSWTMTDGYFVIMNGYVYNGRATAGTRIPEMMESGEIAPIPSNSNAIRDRNKADSLAKFIACVQVAWLMIQCLARTIQHLPMSTLELGTLGYAFITIVTYGIQWHKPKDVRTCIVVQPAPVPAELAAPSSCHSPAGETGDDAGDGEGSELGGLAGAEDAQEDEHGVREGGIGDEDGNHPSGHGQEHCDEKAAVGNPHGPGDCAAAPHRPQRTAFLTFHKERADRIFQWAVTMTCTVYGGWHCLAWNFTFPSHSELWLWRVCSILCVVPGFVIFVIMMPLIDDRNVKRNKASFFRLVLSFVCSIFYMGARAAILVEMFIGLRRLPAGAFDTVRWTTFIPHF